MKRNNKLLITLAAVLVLVALILVYVNGSYQTRMLFDAINNNSYVAAQDSIDHGGWVNARKHLNIPLVAEIVFENPTPLDMACKLGNQELVELLISNGADVNKGNKLTKDTPLLNALHGTKHNRFSLAMYLIESGADIYNIDQVEYLWRKIVFIANTDDEETTQEGFELFVYLAENNVPMEMDFGTENLLTYAARYNNYMVVKYLLEEAYYDVDVCDSAQNTALIISVKYEQVETVSLLMELGANVSIADAEGKTALDYAMENDSMYIVTLLTESNKA